jgi:hypothetical protein
MWKCVDAELQRQIRCFLYVELSDVPRLQEVKKKPSDSRGISDYILQYLIGFFLSNNIGIHFVFIYYFIIHIFWLVPGFSGITPCWD